MKKSILFSAIFAMLLCSCKKKDDSTTTPGGTDNTATWGSANVKSDMITYLNTKAPALNAYTVDATIGGTVTNDSVQVLIPANAFANANGSAYSGTVNLKMQTIRSIADMLYSGVTTVAGNGELLVSGGMFRLEAYDAANNKLKLKPGSTLMAVFPRYDDKFITFMGKDQSGANNKVVWDKWDSLSMKRTNNGTIILGLDSLFKYTNLDAYMNASPLTNITVSIPAGFTNKNTECFLKYTGENASAYIPSNASLKAFSTTGAYYKVVEGKSVKVICFSKKDGKFYYQVKPVTSIVTNQTLTMDNMAETTEANLQSIIALF